MEQNMPKISIIIPIFNVEKYLTKCLQSLVNQTFQDIEILCINDGSTDNSLKIAETFAEKYPNIKNYSKENSGVSDTRNFGIKHANSDYIMFLDGDDWYNKNACELAYLEITQTDSDIGIFGIIEKYWLLEKQCILNKNIKRAKKDPSKKDLWKFLTYSVNKIYKKDFLRKNEIEFPKGIKTAEDLTFSAWCLFNNPKCCFIDKPLYYYRKNRLNSATTNKNGVKNDLEALKNICNTKLFQEQEIKSQVKLVEKFCSGSWNYYKRNRSDKDLQKDIKNLVEYIDQNFPQEELTVFKMYNRVKALANKTSF